MTPISDQDLEEAITHCNGDPALADTYPETNRAYRAAVIPIFRFIGVTGNQSGAPSRTPPWGSSSPASRTGS